MYGPYVLLISLFRAYGALLYASHGDNVTLPCFYDSGENNLCWYKQVAGEPPQIMSSFYKHSTSTFHSQFKDDKRFSVHTGAGFYHLNISSVQESDSAMYYCGQTRITVTKFRTGIFLVLKESSCRSLLQQPASDSAQPGGSVTLNCTVHTGTSDGEHSVYWFKKETANSRLGIVYTTHTRSGRQCVKSPGPAAQAQGCVYSFSKSKVKPSDAGMYYCAVASCGHILFGNGMMLNVEGEQFNASVVLMCCLVAALLLSAILNAMLLCILCKMSRRNNLQSGGFHLQISVPETADSQIEESEAMQYVPLDIKKQHSKRRRPRSKEGETVYSAVRLSDISQT